MFDSIHSMPEALERFRHIQEPQDFQSALQYLRDFMKNMRLQGQELMELERRAFYFPNEYSEKDTRDRIAEACKRVTDFIEQLMNEKTDTEKLHSVLDNFYLFLENLIEKKPHKSGTLGREQLLNLRIGNEYDVQHFLYAYLKPLYPQARREVSEDAGYGSVRADIFLDTEHVIEIKCTRATMKLKKLTEEIEADIVHYKAHNICFYIYDKEKIIENPQAFKMNYESIVKEKEIHITILQPRFL